MQDKDIVYRYDGTLDGFLCCVFRAVRCREQPMMILRRDEMQSLLFSEEEISTVQENARRVCDAIGTKIGAEFMDFVRRGLLTQLPGREMYLLSTVRRGFREGVRVLNDMSDPTVNRLAKAILHLNEEAHLYCGFVRFQDSNGVLSAVIEPKNRVLPLLMNHFCDRYTQEAFLIYDKTHGEALVHAASGTRILPIEDFAQPSADEREKAYRMLWRGFFRSVEIEPRRNPVCQKTHMPMRYWSRLTEMQTDETMLPGTAGV